MAVLTIKHCCVVIVSLPNIGVDQPCAPSSPTKEVGNIAHCAGKNVIVQARPLFCKRCLSERTIAIVGWWTINAWGRGWRLGCKAWCCAGHGEISELPTVSQFGKRIYERRTTSKQKSVCFHKTRQGMTNNGLNRTPKP